MNEYRRDFGLNSGLIDHLYTRLGTTSNYSAIANLNNSQITIATAKSFPACCVFTSRYLATTSNSVDSSASRAKGLSERRLPSSCLFSSQTPVQKWPDCSTCLPYNPFARIEYKTPFLTVPLLLHAYPLPREYVYQAEA
jgi:hypothetical protein